MKNEASWRKSLKNGRLLLMPSQSIEWLYEDEIWEAISSLKEQYENDPICIINFNPIEYILN
jgi:hypothetical protein